MNVPHLAETKPINPQLVVGLDPAVKVAGGGNRNTRTKETLSLRQIRLKRRMIRPKKPRLLVAKLTVLKLRILRETASRCEGRSPHIYG
jgi:hypothetical protein